MFILKLIVKLVFIILIPFLTAACFFGDLASKLATYIVGPFILFCLICAVYTLTKADWMQFGLLMGIATCALFAAFGALSIVELGLGLRNSMVRFLHS